jgi:hypothetical protein
LNAQKDLRRFSERRIFYEEAGLPIKLPEGGGTKSFLACSLVTVGISEMVFRQLGSLPKLKTSVK